MPKTKKTSTNIKWGESYTSLLLGIIVVIVAFLLIFSVIRNRSYNLQTTSSVNTENQEVRLPKNYEVKEGENLWTISEKLYKTGYNWVDIAQANKLMDPNTLYVGTKLVIPNVGPKLVKETSQENAKSITEDKYTVQEGDCLWDIAIRAYGDGYKWVNLAKANNISNPDLIFSGNVFKIPR